MKILSGILLFIISLASQAKIYRPMDPLNQLYWDDIYGKTANQVQELSLKEYREFVKIEVNEYERHPHFNTDSKKPVNLSLQKAKLALKAVDKNPVVGQHMYYKYDPYNQGIGFCFGRAMFVDLYLSMNGLNRASIKKAFVVGPMKSGSDNWAWHVTTIVQSKDSMNREVWLAIDPVVSKVVDVRMWYKEMLKSSVDGKLRLYITDAGKFGQMPSRYDEIAISDSFYNKYFTDMMDWFGKNDISNELGL